MTKQKEIHVLSESDIKEFERIAEKLTAAGLSTTIEDLICVTNIASDDLWVLPDSSNINEGIELYELLSGINAAAS